MNKDVIYIEPEDDITDIILKIENSKEKIVALVPPKKAGVFRSVVNIKLMAKTATTAKKKIVLVTTDPSIKKIAANVKLPVTKNLQSAPTIPAVENSDDEISSEELFETPEEDDTDAQNVSEIEDNATEEGGTKTKEAKAESLTAKQDEEEDENKDEQDDSTGKDEDAKTTAKKDRQDNSSKTSKASKSKSSGAGFLGWLKNNKKLSIALGTCSVLLIIFLVWALVIAPAVSIQISIRTNSNNFSENVTFTTVLSEENADEGRFYLEEKKVESSQEVKFEATGKKNVGKKATGEVDVYAYFPLNIPASTQIKEGEQFTISGLVYTATEQVVLEYDGKGKEDCANKTKPEGLVDYGCRVNGAVPVVASEPGTKYNIAASSSGWDTNARVFAYSSKDMTGGTDEEITIVTQADIDKAKAALAESTPEETENKKDLLYQEQISESDLAIDSSFRQTANDAVPTPAVGEEVKEGVTPMLKATTKASVYVVDKTKIEQFIAKKAELGENKKIYEMKKPFIESFMETSAGFTGKLKTSYAVGPRITENDVIERIKGKGLGEAQHDLKDIEGIEVRIDKSVPWVSTIPSDPNKITIVFEVKDQNGGKIEAKWDNEEDNNKQDSSDSSQDETTKE